MSKIKKLETKKLLKELDFVESDYDYKSEIVSEVDSLFLNSVNEFLSKNPKLKEVFDNKINQKIDSLVKKREEEISSIIEEDERISNLEDEQEIIDTTIDDESKSIDKSPNFKKLYRDIVKLTHPDKIIDKKLNDLYIKANKFYESDDIAGIYSICNELNIEYEVEDKDNELISTKITNLKERIGFMESTFTWKWHFSSDESEKDNIILSYIRMQIG